MSDSEVNNLQHVTDRASDVRELGKVLAESQLFTREPWRLDRQRRLYQCRSIRPIDESTKDGVADLAKNSLLAPLEVLCLHYLVFAVEKGPETLVSLLTEADHNETIRRHNWMVAEASGEAFCERYGPHIEATTFPLFPPDRRFTALNVKMMSAQARSVDGGGHCEDISYMFRKGKVEDHPQGAGFVAPVQTGTEGSFVDLSSVECAFEQLMQRVNTLESGTQSRRQQNGRGGNYGRPHWGPQRGQQNQQYYNQRQPQQQRYALRGGAGGNLSTVAEKTAT